MHAPRGDRGSALVVAMIAIFSVAGLIAALLTVSMSTSDLVERERYRAEAFDDAQLGMDRALATLYKAPINGGLLTAIGDDGTSVTWQAFTDSNGATQDAYSVYVKSFKRDPNLNVGANDFDIYEVTTVARSVGVARRGLRMVVAVPVTTAGSTTTTQVVTNPTETDVIKEAFPSAFGAVAGATTWSSAASISGYDHDPAGNILSGDGVFAMSGAGITCHQNASVTTMLDGVQEFREDAMTDTTANPPQIPIPDLVALIETLPEVQAASTGLPNKRDMVGWGVTGGFKVVKANFSGILNSSKLAAGQTGTGILLVTGDVAIQADFRWKGIVIIKGNLETRGNAGLSTGAFLSTGSIFAQAGIDYRYSSEAIGDVLKWANNGQMPDLESLVTVTKEVTISTMTNVGVPRRIVWKELDDAQITQFLASIETN